MYGITNMSSDAVENAVGAAISFHHHRCAYVQSVPYEYELFLFCYSGIFQPTQQPLICVASSAPACHQVFIEMDDVVLDHVGSCWCVSCPIRSMSVC